MACNVLPVVSAWCVAYDLHRIVSWPHQCACLRQLMAQWWDCRKSQTAHFSVIIITIIIFYWVMCSLLNTVPIISWILHFDVLFCVDLLCVQMFRLNTLQTGAILLFYSCCIIFPAGLVSLDWFIFFLFIVTMFCVHVCPRLCCNVFVVVCSQHRKCDVDLCARQSHSMASLSVF